RAPIGRAALEFLGRPGAGIRRVHLALQRLELLEREVARAAERRGRPQERAARGIELRRSELCRALLGEIRHEDVGGRVQVALIVTTHEVLVLRERHVALEDACAHPRAGLVALLGVLGKLERAAAPVADRKRRLLESVVSALLEGALERTGAHLFNEIEGPGAELNVLVPASGHDLAAGRPESRESSGGKSDELPAHRDLLFRGWEDSRASALDHSER